jgi:hypothetical protein
LDLKAGRWLVAAGVLLMLFVTFGPVQTASAAPDICAPPSGNIMLIRVLGDPGKNCLCLGQAVPTFTIGNRCPQEQP